MSSDRKDDLFLADEVSANASQATLSYQRQRSRPCPRVVDLRKPFLVMREAAFFLQIKKSQAHYLYETGQLPGARLPDGSEWMPFDKRLVRAVDFYELLEVGAKALFVEWQLGVMDIPAFDTLEPPPPLDTLVRRSDV